METLLKLGYWKILKLFYDNKNFEIHLREIARRTRLNENSASRFLEKLEKDGLLRSKKDANLKKYYLRKNRNTYSYFTMFDTLRLEKLPSVRQNAISYFLKTLKKKPITTILFGSTAKGTYSDDSDIDLILVVNTNIDTKEAEKEADALTAMRISSIQIKYSDFKKELRLKQDKVIQSALNTGYPITNHIEYYGDLFDETI